MDKERVGNRAVKLPDFRGTQCQHLTACAEAADSGQLSFIDKLGRKEWTAAYKAGEKDAYVRVLATPKKSRHLHVDVTLAEFFIRKPPETTHSLQDIEPILQQAIGARVEAGVSAGVTTPFERLPVDGLIRSMSLQKKSGNVTIRMAGCTLSFEGAPLEEMEWSMENGSDNVRITLQASKTVEIQENYLIDLLDWMGVLYNSFVLGQELGRVDARLD